MAFLTAGIALGFSSGGVGAVGLLAVVIFVFQYLLQAGIQAYERGEELERRTRELASLQVGVLRRVLQTLSMRDGMTARHCAAVARYSREIAAVLGLPSASRTCPHRRPAPRHRQVHLARPDPHRRSRLTTPSGRSSGSIPSKARGLFVGSRARPRRRHRPQPPREVEATATRRHTRRRHPARLAHHLGRPTRTT